MLSVALIGNYQIGKSSLVNALLKENKALMGNGLATTHQVQRYPLSDFVEILDTPGRTANQQDDDTTQKAVNEADYIIYLHENQMLGDDEVTYLADLVKRGKPICFLLNCTDSEKWSPDDDINKEIAQTIEACLSSAGLSNSLQVCGKETKIFSCNIRWVQYALGLLEPNSQEAEMTREFARDELNLPAEDFESEERLRSALMERSAFPVVRDFIFNLPFDLLRKAVANPQREYERFLAIFKAQIDDLFKPATKEG